MAKDAAVDYKQQLIQRIQTKQAVVAIYGLGYVGLPLALRFSQAGYRVLGFDTDSTKVDKLNRGQSYIERIKPAAIAAAQAAGFIASADYARSAAADALIICVPTPLGKHRNPDLSFVLDTVEGMRSYLRAGQVVCLESTTYPGTSEEEILPRIQSQGLRVGEECFLVYSPEREDPGNPHFHTQIIPKVCGGYSEHCLAVGVKLYSAVIDQVVAVSSLQTAEMTKLLENIYRAVNIGLVNELKIVADKMHIDIREVIAAAATKPFGFVPFYPGAGLGGHCIPIDPFYLTWKARELGINTRFIELAGEVNAYMPEWVIDKIIGALNAQKKAVNAAPILVLGVAYKKNVDDMRESPSLYIMQRLRDLGARIAYSDPHIPKLPKLRNYDFDLHSVNLTPARLRTYAAVVLLTPHDLFDFDHIGQHARLIIDAHGVIPPTANAIVVRA